MIPHCAAETARAASLLAALGVGMDVGVSRRPDEKQFQVSPEMIDANDRDFRALPGLGEDEGALEDRLNVQREAFGAASFDAAYAERLRDIGFETREMLVENPIAGFAYGGVGRIDFLHHRAEQTGE